MSTFSWVLLSWAVLIVGALQITDEDNACYGLERSVGRLCATSLVLAVYLNESGAW